MLTARTLRVVVADDHALVRDLVAHRLEQEADIDVVASVGTASEAVRAVQRHQPDLAVLDIEMPGLPTFDAVRSMRAFAPELRIVFLTAFENDGYVEQALRVRGASYVSKSESIEVVVEALRSAVAGRPHFSPAVRARLRVGPSGLRLDSTGASRLSAITPRERSVLICVARGMTNKEIAATLHISVKTVDHHCEHLMDKLDLHDRVALARFAIREKMISA